MGETLGVLVMGKTGPVISGEGVGQTNPHT